MRNIYKTIHFLKTLFIYILVLQCLSVTVSGQQEASATSIRFSCVIWKKLSYSELYYKQAKEYIQLDLLPNNRSELYSLKGMKALELYILDVDDKGQSYYKLVGQSPLPANAKRALFFIVKGPVGEDLPLRVLGIDDSLKGFPRGHTRFVNMSTTSLMIGFGGEVTELAPKAMCTIQSNVPKNGGLMPFLLTDSEGKKLYQTRLMSRPHGRDMVFILPPNRPKGRIGIKFLPQVVRNNSSSETNE